MKKKRIISAFLRIVLVLALMLSIMPAMTLKPQAAEISTITVTSKKLFAPNMGELIVLPEFTVTDSTPVKVEEYGWTCDNENMYEGDAFTPGTWRIYACAQIDKESSTDNFVASPTLTVDGESWIFSETFSDEYYHYAIFYKEYGALTSLITVSGDPTIPETVSYTVIDELKLANYVSGGTAPYTYSKISGPEWLNLDPSTGVISGIAPAPTSYNDDLNVLITDANGQKGVAIVTVGPTRPDLRTPVYEINARGTSPADLVKAGDTLQPISFTILNPACVSSDPSKDFWQKYNTETGEWVKQEFGTTFTAGRYRYRTYMSADRGQYSFVHPDFYQEIEEDVWKSWKLDNYSSFDSWAYYYSDDYIVMETIDTVTISGVPYPMAGIGATSGEITAKEDGVSTADEIWYNKTDDIAMSDGESFESGKEYKIRMTLYSKEGYIFADESDLKIKVNGLTPTTIKRIDDGEVAIECDIPMAVASSNLYVVTAGALNIRDNASMNAERVGGLKYGDLVQAKAIQGGKWVQFEKDGTDVWVNWNYLALTYTAETAIYPVKYTVTAGALNVRSAPHIPSDSEPDNRIGSYTAGKEVLVTGWVDYGGDKWLVVDYPGDDGHQVGFIMEKYVVSEGESIETVTEPAEVNVDSTELDIHTDGGVPAKVTISTKSAIAVENKVNLTPENFTVNEDGSCSAQIYPGDAMNFANLKTANIKFPAGLGLDIENIILNADGSIQVMLSPVAYTFSKGDDGTWTKGSSDNFDLTVNRSVNDTKTFDLFASIEVDGEVVDPVNYAASPGSLNVSLKVSYLQTLAEGSHVIKINFEDGSAETTLTINEVASGDNSSGANGSDSNQSGDTEKTDKGSVTNGSGSNQSGDTEKADKGSVTNASSSNKSSGSVNTGDNNNTAFWLILIGVAAGGIMFIMRRQKISE